MKTTQVTLRNIDEKLKRLIDQNARKQNKSINTYVVDVVKDSVGYTSHNAQPAWKKFSGSITADGIDQATLDSHEAVDEHMWK
jgi:hypothetical protein